MPAPANGLAAPIVPSGPAASASGSTPPPSASIALPPALIASAPVPGEPGQLVYGGDLDVRPGDFVAADIGPGTSDGFLGRVLTVSKNAGSTTLGTEPAALTDVIADGDIDQTIEASTVRAQAGSVQGRALSCDAGGVSSDFDVTATISVSGRWRLFSLKTAEIKAGIRPS